MNEYKSKLSRRDALRLAGVGALSAGSVFAATTPSWAAGDGRLVVDAWLGINERIWAADGSSFLIQQADGNLVLYTRDGRALWATMKLVPDTRTILQRDGNLVQVAPGGVVVWSSMTNHPDNSQNSGTWAVVQNDLHFVIYDAGNKGLWSSRDAALFAPWGYLEQWERDSAGGGGLGWYSKGGRTVFLDAVDLPIVDKVVRPGTWQIAMYDVPEAAYYGPAPINAEKTLPQLGRGIDKRKVLYLQDKLFSALSMNNATVTWSFYDGNRTTGGAVYRRFSYTPNLGSERNYDRWYAVDPGLLWRTGDVIVEFAPLGDKARYNFSLLTEQ